MQTQTLCDSCSHRSTSIEQSWRPRWTGFRFPGVKSGELFLLLLLFLFSWLVIFFLISSPRAGPPPRIPCFLVIVSGVVNQLFLWLRASFTLSGFHCSSKIGKEAWESAGAPTGLPGQGQKPIGSLLLLLSQPNWQFEQLCFEEELAPFIISVSHRQKKKVPVVIFAVVIVISHPVLAACVFSMTRVHDWDKVGSVKF